MSYNIKISREKDIYKKINEIIDEYLIGKTSGTKLANNIISRKDYEDYSRFINDTYADEKI
jgi:hypothetical protein